jgi:hypothetical protein
MPSCGKIWRTKQNPTHGNKMKCYKNLYKFMITLNIALTKHNKIYTNHVGFPTMTINEIRNKH